MSVTVRVPTILRTYTDGSAEVSVAVADGATLADVLAALEVDHAGIAARVLDDNGALRRFVDHHRDMGFLIALDDLGAGHSNLPRIAQLRPHIIKLDRGLISGIALALREAAPHVRVIGAEPALADDAAASKAAGALQPARPPQSIADGLLTSLGPLTWPVVRDVVERIIVVDEGSIVASMRLVFERMKQVIEPSAAVPLAAVLAPTFAAEVGGRRVGVVLCGGNVDLAHLPWRAP